MLPIARDEWIFTTRSTHGDNCSKSACCSLHARLGSKILRNSDTTTRNDAQVSQAKEHVDKAGESNLIQRSAPSQVGRHHHHIAITEQNDSEANAAQRSEKSSKSYGVQMSSLSHSSELKQ